MTKIDNRKNYYLTIDTETTNGFDDPIVYDIGGCINDKKGNVYETFSFIVYETFYGMSDLMQSAYYAEKIPMYKEQIAKGERIVKGYSTIKWYIADLCKKQNVKAIIAHNMRFDYRATTCTQRYLTKSKYRYFLPYGIELWDSLKMASDTIGKQKTYRLFCETYGFMTNHRKPRPQLKAETLYRYITGDPDFIESHTGLEDVKIEREITAHCMKQHKKMRKLLYA